MAGLGRRTFQAGEVLTASNVMAYLQDQAVMNFAGTAARGSAIGTAVSEGMVSYLQDSNVVQTYDGSAWKPLANLSNVGLVPIVPTTVTFVGGTGSTTANGAMNFTTCTSISVDGVFTSEYKNYLLIVSGTRPTTASGYIYLRLRTGSPAADVSTSYSGGLTAFYYGFGGSTAFGASSTTDTLISRTYYDKFAAFENIFQPQEATGTKFSGTGHGSDPANGTYMITGGEHNSTTQFTGVTIFSSGSSATGQAQIFGYND